MNLEQLFDFYVETEEYSQEYLKSCLPEINAEVFNVLQSALSDASYQEIEDMITELIYETEKLGFINGFKFLSRIN